MIHTYEKFVLRHTYGVSIYVKLPIINDINMTCLWKKDFKQTPCYLVFGHKHGLLEICFKMSTMRLA